MSNNRHSLTNLEESYNINLVVDREGAPVAMMDLIWR